jgi:hypothetical protein
VRGAEFCGLDGLKLTPTPETENKLSNLSIAEFGKIEDEFSPE